MCLKVYSFMLLFCLFFIFASPAPNFGKFDVIIEDFQVYKGPKHKDCAKWDMKVENKRMLVFNMTTNQNVAPLRIKVVVSANGKELVRLQMGKICENVFLKPLFTSMFNANNRCVIPKGTYYRELDMQEIIRQYYGGEFLLGNIAFRSVLYNDECNFCSSLFNVTLAPNKS